MISPVLLITAIESGFGFILSGIILFLLLSRGRKAYHYLFAAFLFICLFWDLGTFLIAVRNSHLDELVTIGYVIGFPCLFLPTLLVHFSLVYSGKPIKWLIALCWGISGVFFVLGLLGLYWKIDGTYQYPWGNIFRVVPSFLDPIGLVSWFGLGLYSCWILWRASKRAPSPLERRHYKYVMTGLLVITLAIVKVLITMGIDLPFLLPLGMFLVDVFNAIIGVAIIKNRLFDITLIVKKGTVYSILAGLLVFIYSFSEHMLVTYIGEVFARYSLLAHFISVAVGIAILIPVKNRLERSFEGYFAQKKLEF
jgi:hypothetical protein